MNTKLLLSLAGVSLCAASAFAFVQERGAARAGASRHPALAARLRERFARRRDAVRERVIERLGVTDSQREQMRARADAARPTAERFRSEARAILERARESAPDTDRAAVRERTRGELRALFQRTYSELEPSARALVGALTPEQRAKLEHRAEARGRTLDEERMKKAAALLLLRRERHEGARAR